MNSKDVLSRVFSSELFIILLVLLIHLSILNNREVNIRADGRGYYEYLPALFIYNDLSFSYRDTLKVDQKFIFPMDNIFVDYKGKKIDKYFLGLSVLWSPFFTLAHAYAKLSVNYADNGFSLPYQKAILIASLFYLWLGLYYLKRILLLLKIDKRTIILSQFLIVLSTPLLHYATFGCAVSHVYSFSLITVFSFYFYSFYLNRKNRYLLISSFILGLIILLRPINILSILIPIFLIPGFEELKLFIRSIFKRHLGYLLLSVAIIFAILSLQFLVWKIQTGEFIIYAYGNEKFNFNDPHFIDFLFSYRKGAFIYSPILLVALAGGLIHFLRIKKYYSALFGLVLFSLFIYVLSSWWYWSYGGSFGSRPLIDIYLFFAILLALFIKSIKQIKWKISMLLVFSTLICVNIIQAYQFQYYILLGDSMTKEDYWKVFLKTEDKYKGYLFYKEGLKDFKNSTLHYSNSSDFEEAVLINENSFKSIFAIDSLNFDQINDIDFALIKIDGCIKNSNSQILLHIKDSQGKTIFWQSKNSFYFLEENSCDGGQLYLKVNSLEANCSLNISISAQQDEFEIKKISVSFGSKT